MHVTSDVTVSNLQKNCGVCHSEDVADTKTTKIEVTAVGKSGNVWFKLELPESMVTALVTVLEELPQITQLRIEVTR